MLKNDYIFKKFFIIFVHIIIILYIKFHYKYNYKNKQILLTIYFGGNQGYHPKVLYFDKLFNGYKYWMVFTPYPNADATKENPIINVSNDLIHWINPKGLKNPLDIPSISDVYHYNSDPHLVFNRNTNELIVFWRYVNIIDNEVTIYLRKSKDGINWSEKEIFIKSNDSKKNDYISPSIIIENNIYKIWYVHKKKIFYCEFNGKNFTIPRVININYKYDYHSWHLDIIYNKEKKLYELITCAYINVKIKNTMPLFYSSSKDNINWSTPIKILEPSNKKLLINTEGLYRSSLLYFNKKYYLFYSSHDIKYNCGIGLIYGENITNLKPFW